MPERRKNTNNTEGPIDGRGRQTLHLVCPQKLNGRRGDWGERGRGGRERGDSGAASIQRVTVLFSLRDFLQLPVTIDNDKWTRTDGTREAERERERERERENR